MWLYCAIILHIKVNNNYISFIVTSADKHMAELEVLQMPESSFAYITFKEPKSPGMGNCCSYLITIKEWFLLQIALLISSDFKTFHSSSRSYAEMELNLPLSPHNHKLCLPDQLMSNRQLPAEIMPPVYKQWVCCFCYNKERRL